MLTFTKQDLVSKRDKINFLLAVIETAAKKTHDGELSVCPTCLGIFHDYQLHCPCDDQKKKVL